MIGNASFHSGGHPKRRVNPGEVVVHEVDGNGVSVVLDLFGESIG
jgi:hypothetical protein